ncbi:MAG: tetratricopeptide repeat protein [Verrucomicrobiae bacterium]|nr:tetratricopeptide repeat protein [Verrucomicrobiae bacterium]
MERHRELAAKHPDNELARFSLGRALLDRGDHAGARGHLAAALERRPDWMAVQILIGRCDLELGNLAAARAAFERARELAILQHHDGPLAEVEALLADLPATAPTTS